MGRNPALKMENISYGGCTFYGFALFLAGYMLMDKKLLCN
jgi:hypothetical protein